MKRCLLILSILLIHCKEQTISKEKNVDIVENEIVIQEEEYTTHYVNSLKEFINGLGNNRTIYIQQPINISKEVFTEIITLDSLKLYQEQSGFKDYRLLYKNLYFDVEYFQKIPKEKLKPIETYNDFSLFMLRIKNTSNLTIKGHNNEKVDFVSEGAYSSVVRFENNKNVVIQNINFISDIDYRGNFSFSGIGNDEIRFQNCYMNSGIYIEKSNKISFENISFSNAHSGVFIKNVNHAYFTECNITDNAVSRSLIDITNSNVIFNNSTIKNNKSFDSTKLVECLSYGNNKTSSCKFTKCTITDNIGFKINKEECVVFDEYTRVDINIH